MTFELPPLAAVFDGDFVVVAGFESGETEETFHFDVEAAEVGLELFFEGLHLLGERKNKLLKFEFFKF